MMYYIVLVLVIVISSVFLFVWNSGKGKEQIKKKEPKNSGKNDQKKKKLDAFNTLQVLWKEEDTNKFFEKLTGEGFIPLKIFLSYPSHYVLPSINQCLLTQSLDELELLISKKSLFSKDFDRFFFQPFYHSSNQMLSGAVRFNDHVVGPMAVNDILEFDGVNGGATISFSLEMTYYLRRLISSDFGFSSKIIDFPQIEEDQTEMNTQKAVLVKRYEIEYVFPMPINTTYKFNCSKIPNTGEYEISISNFSLGSRKKKFIGMKATVYENEEEEEDMYNIVEDDSPYYDEHYKFLENDKFPTYITQEIEKYQNNDDFIQLEVGFYENNTPEKCLRHPNSGVKLCLPKHFLAARGLSKLYGMDNLLKFAYANSRAFFNTKNFETHAIMYFGEECADPKNKYRVHQGIISTVLDNYACLHVVRCMDFNNTSFTKTLKISFLKDFFDEGIKRYQFVKMSLRYRRGNEIMMNGNFAVYGTASGMITSVDGEKKYVVLEDSIFTSIKMEEMEE